VTEADREHLAPLTLAPGHSGCIPSPLTEQRPSSAPSPFVLPPDWIHRRETTPETTIVPRQPALAGAGSFVTGNVTESVIPQSGVHIRDGRQAAGTIVYSRTLAEPRSTRTRIEREFDPDAVRRLNTSIRWSRSW
jgi:hypothetical protein